MSIWFTASAIAPALAERWGLSSQQSALLTSAVQFGFVGGTALAVLLNLADLLPARVYVASSAALAALCNLGLLFVDGLLPALALRLASGVFLAGVYPPAMKMVATWFVRRRGMAIGIVVGALVLGKSLPYTMRGLSGGRPEWVLASASIAALIAAALILWLYRDGPHPFPRPRFSWRLAGRVLADRPTRLAIGGDLGHMWELYALWAWTPIFLGAALGAQGWSPERAALASALIIASGGLGSAVGGVVADLIGRARWVMLCLLLSGLCSATLGFLFAAPPGLLLPLCVLWGIFVVADSAQFSAMVTESCPPDAVGTALTLQTSAGFLLTMATIQLLPRLQSALGWGWAFALLAIGPVFGIFWSSLYARSENLDKARARS
jgi:sugar phosphate permease